MAKFITKWDTEAAYNAAKDSLATPQVAYIEETNGVDYKPLEPTPPTPSHDYVDLGLPSGTKWATMNVGASSESDYGNYYRYGKGSEQYNSSQSDYTGRENPLASSADTATQVWGGSWHTPTYNQFKELTANTTYEVVTINEKIGFKFASKTDSSKYVFFPLAGYNNGTNINSNGRYWTSTNLGGSYAGFLQLDYSGGYRGLNQNPYSYGYSIRPVMDA